MHPGQQQIRDEAARFNVLECGRRFGKSELGLQLVQETALDHDLPAAFFSPTYKMLAEAWRTLTSRLASVAVRVSQQERRVELVTGGAIDFWSLDDPNSGRGRKYARVVIDEASIVRDLQEAWEQAIRPTLTDHRGDAWFLGTPKGRNYFHRLFVRGESEDGWRSWRRGTRDNPTIAAEEVEDARRDLPEAVFAQEYLGIPADDGGNPFDLSALRRCISYESNAPPVVWGWDLAKSHDWTVGIALDADGAVCRFCRFQLPWFDTIRRIEQETEQTAALIDSTGVGDPIVEALQRNLGPQVGGFKFTSQSKQQLLEGLCVAIQRGEIAYPDGPIVSELETFEYEYTRTGVRYSAPSGLHDDCVCALALAVWAKREARSPGDYGLTV